MSGTIEGGKSAAKTIIKKRGPEFYITIGRLGGLKSRGGGFAAGEAGRERARIYGAIGGRKSRKPKKTNEI